MTLADPTALNFESGAGAIPPGSAQTQWGTIHENSKITADTSTEPSAIDQTGARWINLPVGVTRVDLRHVWTSGGTVNTAPVVSVWTSDHWVEGGQLRPPESAEYELIASAVTLTSTKVLDNGDWDYGATITTASDLRGAKAVLVQVTTAAVGPDDGFVQARVLN